MTDIIEWIVIVENERNYPRDTDVWQVKAQTAAEAITKVEDQYSPVTRAYQTFIRAVRLDTLRRIDG